MSTVPCVARRLAACPMFVLVLMAAGCTSSGENNSGGNNGDGVKVPDFVDSDDPPYDGSDEVPQKFFELIDGLKTRIELPTGVNLSLGNLRVLTTAGETRVGSDGSVTPALQSFESLLTQIVDGSGNVILYGYTQAAGAAPSPISARSTAEVLLYFALGAWSLPEGFARGDVMHEIEVGHNDIVDNLTSAIEDAMRRNPRAIQDGDAQILDAVTAAKRAILAAGTSDSAKGAYRDGQLERKTQTGGVSNGFVSTNPDRTVGQSGIYLRTSSSSSGILPLNRFRRPARLYAYFTGADSKDGTFTESNPIELAAGPIEIAAAGTYSSEGGLISHLASGGASWDPTQSSQFTLGMQGTDSSTGNAATLDNSDAAIRYADVVVLGPALDGPAVPAILDEPRFADHRAEFLAAIDELTWKTFLLDYLAPLIDEVGIGSAGYTPTETTDARLSALRSLVEPLLAGQQLSIKTTEGYRAALAFCVETFANDTVFRNSYLSIMKRALGPANGALDFNEVNSRAVRALLSTLGGVIISKGAEAPEVGFIYTHLQQSHEADLWRVTIRNVEIYPQAPEVNKQATRIRLSAKVAASDRSLCYEWSSPSGYGYISEIQGVQTGPTFRSNESAINYTSAPNQINNNDLDPVTVTVYDVTDVENTVTNCALNAGLGVRLGSDTVTVYGDGEERTCEGLDLSLYNHGPLSMTVSPNKVLPGDEVTVTISYDFTQTGDSTGQIRLYLPFACSSCATGDCICGEDERSDLLYDGGATALYNVDQTFGATSGIGGSAADGIPGLSTACAWQLEPLFTLPNPDVKEVITHQFTYVFHRNNAPRQPGLGPVCATLIQDPFQPLDQVWYGNWIIARTIGTTAGGVVAQLLDLGADPTFEHGVSDPCDP